MNGRIPEFEDLIDSSTAGRERARFRRVHEALVRAGPLPELPRSLRKPPPVAPRRRRLQPRARSHRYLLTAVAAALAFVVAGGSYSIVSKPSETLGAVAMRATAAAPHARATLIIGARDRAGNVPITLRVRGLPALPAGYEMYLTNKGRVVGACGTFKTDGGATVVRLNVPYPVGEYSGWIIAGRRAARPLAAAVLAT